MSCEVNVMRPAADANKYSRGKLVVVAGSARYPGAAVLAALAGQRMGAGYTQVFTAKRAVAQVRAASPSLVVAPFSEWDASAAETSPERPCAVCVGPGFAPEDDRSGQLALQALKAKCPVLVDGGALVHLASEKALKVLAKRAKAGYATVITPHAGEAAKLAGPLRLSRATPQNQVVALALSLGAVVVLKGPDTFISDGKRTECMSEGTAALAKAGTGDVLAGFIASLLAQGADAFSAATTATVLHARAGVRAAERLTDVCVTAEDVLDSLPQVLREMEGR